MKRPKRLARKQIRAILKVSAAAYVVVKALTKLGDKIDKAIDAFKEEKQNDTHAR